MMQWMIDALLYISLLIDHHDGYMDHHFKLINHSFLPVIASPVCFCRYGVRKGRLTLNEKSRVVIECSSTMCLVVAKSGEVWSCALHDPYMVVWDASRCEQPLKITEFAVRTFLRFILPRFSHTHSLFASQL